MTITDKIRKYYARKDCKLKVLDGGETYGEFDGEYFYAAVSLNYIHKYVLKEKHLIGNVAKRIFQLCKEDFLLPIPCNHAGDLVFCKKIYKESRHGFLTFKTGKKKIELNYNDSYQDKEWLKNFNQYLHI